MRFNCGPGPEERKRWREEAEELFYEMERQRIAAQFKWHRWFALRPVRVADNDCRWLETVERRRVVKEEWVKDVELSSDGYLRFIDAWEFRPAQ